MRDNYWTRKDPLGKLVLCRSDRGDGGWSLHAPWATDEQIRTGEEPPLNSGPAQWFDAWEEVPAGWNRPNKQDRQEAWNILKMRDKVKFYPPAED